MDSFLIPPHHSNCIHHYLAITLDYHSSVPMTEVQYTIIEDELFMQLNLSRLVHERRLGCNLFPGVPIQRITVQLVLENWKGARGNLMDC